MPLFFWFECEVTAFRFKAVCKFDTAHGYCHVHCYYKAHASGESLFNRDISPETFDECRKDIETNWQKYKQSYFAKRRLQE